MKNLDKKRFLVIALACIGGGTALGVQTNHIAAGAVGGIVAFGMLARVGMAVFDMSRHVASQASNEGITPSRKWLNMVGKSLLYMFVPAAIVTAAVIGYIVFAKR
jgi:small-conductance mechanosensitive channel